MRAILDANVLVSALISRIGSPARLIEEWLSGALEIILCPALLEEIERTLSAPKLSGRIDPADATRFLAILRGSSVIVADPSDPPPVQSVDPGDDYLIVLAARERLPIVSGDRHLLTLSEQIPVFSPSDFLAQLV